MNPIHEKHLEQVVILGGRFARLEEDLRALTCAVPGFNDSDTMQALKVLNHLDSRVATVMQYAWILRERLANKE